MSLSVTIKKRFKGFTLDVDFASDGSPLAILGASGSGKSMTLKCIAGIETPDEGRIVLNGRVLFDSTQKINLRPQQRRVGYLFQNYALFPTMTVGQNIACALSSPKKDKPKVIRDLLARFELSGLEKRYPSQLSGGQQQRVALARILAYQPEVLLLDEPFSALDAYLKEALQMDMMNLLKEYSGDAIMVTHNRDEAYRLCQNLMILEAGKVQAIGDTQAMFDRPNNLVAAKLTGCKNFSRARQLTSNTVLAKDWGCALQIETPIPPTLSHIGVRAHYFTPCSSTAVNAIPVKVYQQIESPFEWNVLFKNKAADEKTSTIWWKYAKELAFAQTPDYLCVLPQNILLLEDVANIEETGE